MAKYTVNITGTPSANYGYVTINGTKMSTTGAYEYDTPPTIAVFVSADLSSANSECQITLDGEVVQQGSGSYAVNKTANVFDINITYIVSSMRAYVYSAKITTTVTEPADPMAPYDGHNTNIGQVARQIEAGNVLFGGASREIEKGWTLVGGVQREILFAPDVDPVLGNNTPEQVQAAAQSGQAANYWSVGDKIGITLSGTVGVLSLSGTYYAFILGFDHNSSIEGSNSIHFQFGKTSAGVDIAFCDKNYTQSISGTLNINPSVTNAGGWKSSYMRGTICPAFLSAMPSAWRNVIAPCTKYSDNTGGGSDTASYVTATSDEIWTLAEFEVSGERKYANSAEQNYQKQYDYYKNGSSKIKYKHDATTTAVIWWGRSVWAKDDGDFCCVRAAGSLYHYPSNRSYGFAPGFKVA